MKRRGRSAPSYSRTIEPGVCPTVRLLLGRGNSPVGFLLDHVVPGSAQGIEGMQIGGRRVIVIPPDLGYGGRDNGPIPGGWTLVFVVDLVAIR